jgi:hypothetical protein
MRRTAGTDFNFNELTTTNTILNDAHIAVSHASYDFHSLVNLVMRVQQMADRSRNIYDHLSKNNHHICLREVVSDNISDMIKEHPS